MNGYGYIWTEEKVEKEILNCMEALMIDRMPTASELKSLGRNDLHIKVSRTKKYSGWASYLGLDRKQSDTTEGQKQEEYVKKIMLDKGYAVERMTTKHPYDLLVNGVVKVDVKAGKPYLLHGSRAHTFGLSKRNPTCDIYICLAFDEVGKIERTLIIPSHFAKVVTLCIGKKSKYNRFIDEWNYIEKYSHFYKSVI